MRNFLYLYGKNVVGILIMLVVLLTAGVSLKREWIRWGIVKNQAQKHLTAAALTWDKPALDGMNQRFSTGKRILVSELARARDFDGTDLTKRIRFYDENGNQMTGEWMVRKPGIYRIQATVKSPVSKRVNKKTIIVLIDGGEGE